MVASVHFFGLIVIVTVGYEWRRDEDQRRDVLLGLERGLDSWRSDLRWLNLIAASFSIPLFALTRLQVAEALGGSHEGFGSGFWHCAQIALSVLTLDIFDVVWKAVAPPATAAPVMFGPADFWLSITDLIQKTLTAVIFVASVVAIIRARQAARARIALFDFNPHLILRMGDLGVRALKTRLRKGPPKEGDDVSEKERTQPRYSREHPGYKYVIAALGNDALPDSTTAAWIVRKIRDASAVPEVNERLARYQTFFHIAQKVSVDRQLDRDVKANGALKLKPRPGELSHCFQWKDKPLTDRETYEDGGVEDVCELFRVLTQLYVPVPWDKDSGVRNFLDLLDVPSPAIRIEVARHAATYIAAGPASNAGQKLALAFQREQSARVACAQLEALAPFALKDKAVMERACYWLDSTPLDEFPRGVIGKYVSNNLWQAAARVLLNSNSIATVGNQGIDFLLSHDENLFIRLCAAWLLATSENPFDPDAIEAAKKHMKGRDTYVEECIQRYLARFVEGRARLLEYVESANDSDARATLLLVEDKIDVKDRTPETIESLGRLKGRASVADLAEIALGKLGT